MALEETVTQLRKKALAQRRNPVPDAFQGVSKERIAEGPQNRVREEFLLIFQDARVSLKIKADPYLTRSSL